MYQIYGIRCKENGKIYIGCTRRRLQQRFAQHFSELKRHNKTMRVCKGVRADSPWQVDYDKYGIGAFELYLIEDNVPDEIHTEREEYWIHEYKSHDKRYGYNIHVKTDPKHFEYMVQLPPKPFMPEVDYLLETEEEE